MANLQDVISSNEKINKKIKQIVEMYKSQGKSAFSEEGKLDDDVRIILEHEMKKCVAIYLAEFPEFECKDIENLTVTPTYKKEADCRGNSNGIKVDIGIQPFIDGQKPNQLRGAGIEYTRDSNGRVYIERATGQNLKKSIEPKSSLKVDSTRDQFDYFAELLADGKNDLDWMLDVLPHESMHIFVPGEGVFVEGTTEELSREMADKYGLRLTPTSHQRETRDCTEIRENSWERCNIIYCSYK